MNYIKTEFIATHAKDYGKGHFSDMSFSTQEEAQAEIDRHIDIDMDIKEKEHVEYWNKIAKHMFIIKRVSQVTEERLT